MILEKKSLSLGTESLRPGVKDGISFAWGFPGLVLLGMLVSGLALRFSPGFTPLAIERPTDLWGWAVVAFSCAGTGYLEESFFRFYLIRKLEGWVPWKTAAVVFSAALFALCHTYEGPWGILNAVVAGLFLSILFEKHRSLHGIAWAHACYNAFVYVSGAFS